MVGNAKHKSTYQPNLCFFLATVKKVVVLELINIYFLFLLKKNLLWKGIHYEVDSGINCDYSEKIGLVENIHISITHYFTVIFPSHMTLQSLQIK